MGSSLALLVLCGGMLASAQDSSPSLADVARATRKENSAPGHIAGKHLVNDEEDGPDSTGVWRVRLCTHTPCYELSITLPKTAKWTRAKDEPRPLLIPLTGSGQDAARAIRLFVANSIGPQYAMLDSSKRLFLQGWLARPEYFGEAARISQDEHMQLDNVSAVISHFSLPGTEPKYQGLSIVAATPNGTYGFACVYREVDATDAGSICDGIIKSAHNQALDPGMRPYFPGYQPPQYYPYYPRIDDHRPYDDDPQE